MYFFSISGNAVSDCNKLLKHSLSVSTSFVKKSKPLISPSSISNFIFLNGISLPSLLLQYLNIPPGHDNTINYPLVGRMTNDEELLDIIILTMIEIFKNVDKYIIALPSISNYNNKMYAFLQTKNITTILKDLQSLTFDHFHHRYWEKR